MITSKPSTGIPLPNIDKPRIMASKVFANLRRAILTSVIHHDDLEVPIGLLGQTVERLNQMSLSIIDRNHNGH